jgi:hypothetical protein
MGFEIRPRSFYFSDTLACTATGTHLAAAARRQPTVLGGFLVTASQSRCDNDRAFQPAP